MTPRPFALVRRPLAALLGGALLLVAAGAGADEAPTAPLPTLINHPGDTWYFVGGQLNAIGQLHPGFRARYTGENSLRPEREGAVSYVISMYVAAQIPVIKTEIFVDGEMAAGGGLSKALGVAGFTNLDVVRNPTLGQAPYPARVMLRQIIPLGSRRVEAARGHLGMETRLPEDRVEIKIGKISTVDAFDQNAVGSDSHLQFMNWSVCNNAAYDYAADTRGYTYGIIAELHGRDVSLRLGEMTMPTVANGIDLDLRLDRARGENIELELRPHLLGRAGAVRLLGFANHANMGSYREAIDAFLTHHDKTPDVAKHRRQGRVKYGIGLNADHEITPEIRAFLRAGWSEGAYESFAYTEVNDTFAFGGDLRGSWWRRPGDKIGLAFVTNGASRDHARYLALGGKGFLLGDGKLTYGRENIGELYYNASLYRGVSSALDGQVIQNPGYNRDRGPVVVLSLRLHVEL